MRDSNPRMQGWKPCVLTSSPIGRADNLKCGADYKDRTCDQLVNSQLLYRWAKSAIRTTFKITQTSSNNYKRNKKVFQKRSDVS